YAKARSEFVLILRLEVTRIDRNGEVRPATDFIHVIDRLVGPLFEACRRCDRQMAARRKTHDPDSLGMDAPFPCSAPNQADGPLRVRERAPGGFALRLIGAARNPIFEDDAGHAD